MQKIALLATGDELRDGDVINTNSAKIAAQLTDAGIAVGMHLTCSDDEADICDAIKLLLTRSNGLIMTGGLGPTSDDRTRYALAKYLNRELVFHKPSWDSITERLQKFKITVPENNKQQAMYPEQATIFENTHGTANACYCEYDGKPIFMLPGPPRECLPIIEKNVMPLLKSRFAASAVPKLKWRVFGRSEGQFGEEMDNLLCDYPCTTAYCWAYPYLDFKVDVHDENKRALIKQVVEDQIAKHIICNIEQTASDLLSEVLNELTETMVILDKVTGGLLQSKISTPDNHEFLHFTAVDSSTVIIIDGLQAYWQNQKDEQKTDITISFIDDSMPHQETITVEYRHQRIRLYVVEAVAFKILQWLGTQGNNGKMYKDKGREC